MVLLLVHLLVFVLIQWGTVTVGTSLLDIHIAIILLCFWCNYWFLQAAASPATMLCLLVAATYVVYMGSIVLGYLL